MTRGGSRRARPDTFDAARLLLKPIRENRIGVFAHNHHGISVGSGVPNDASRRIKLNLNVDGIPRTQPEMPLGQRLAVITRRSLKTIDRNRFIANELLRARRIKPNLCARRALIAVTSISRTRSQCCAGLSLR